MVGYINFCLIEKTKLSKIRTDKQTEKLHWKVKKCVVDLPITDFCYPKKSKTKYKVHVSCHLIYLYKKKLTTTFRQKQNVSFFFHFFLIKQTWQIFWDVCENFSFKSN